MIKKDFGGKLSISSVVLGCDGLGYDFDKKSWFELFDEYVALGGTTLDTARMYCDGESEEMIGNWVKERNSRHSVEISTKCAHPPVNDMKKSRLSREDIFSDVEKSLTALKTDYIDILWLHRDDTSLDVEPIIDSLNELIKQGKILSFGSSNWGFERIKKANDYAKKSGQDGFIASQIKWCIAHSAPDFKDDPTLIEMNKEEYKFYKESKLGVFAFASQAKGFFYKYDQGGIDALSPKAKQRYYSKENVEIYHKLKEICQKENISLTAAVLSSLTSNTDFNTVAIAGCKNANQVLTSMQAADTTLYYNEILNILKY